MLSAMLRSGDIKDYTPLGQDGSTVFSVAPQIREIIRRRCGERCAEFLAVPQRNDSGSRIDWYVPFASSRADGQYNIVPWADASDEERRSAYLSLTNFESQMLSMGKASFDNKAGLSGDALLFSRLMYGDAKHYSSPQLLALHYPNAEHVYIVDGRPVITFWGFTERDAPLLERPFLQLRPAERPVPVVEEPAPYMPPPGHPWWWLLWFLIPLLLLLLGLLFYFLLRNRHLQAPSGILDAPSLSQPKAALPKADLPQFDLPKMDKPGEALPEAALPKPEWIVPKGVVPNTAADGGSIAGADGGALPAVPPVDPQPDAQTPNADGSRPAAPPVGPQLDKSAPDAEGGPPAAPPADPQLGGSPANANAQPKDLNIPPEAAAKGDVGFLNGRWNAGAGIQDKASGKPLRLEYEFHNGKGQVTLRRADGVQCIGAIVPAMNGTALSLNASGQANCSDGSTYAMPKVRCKPNADGTAACTGSYGGSGDFPIFMRAKKP